MKVVWLYKLPSSDRIRSFETTDTYDEMLAAGDCARS